MLTGLLSYTMGMNRMYVECTADIYHINNTKYVNWFIVVHNGHEPHVCRMYCGYISYK